MAKGVKFEPTEEQLRWLAGNYHCTRNAELCAALGIGDSLLHRLARRLGLRKSEEFMRLTQAETARAAQLTGRATGRFRRQSEAMKGHCPEHLRAYKFKPGNKPRVPPEAQARRVEKWKETLKTERRRVLFGLPQRTRMRVVAQSRGKVCYRYNMRRRGYVELPGEKNVLRYPSEDMRRPLAEAGAARHGIKILPLDGAANGGQQ